MFLVGRGGREGRALDETRLVAVVVVIVLLLLFVAIVVFVVGIFLMNKFSKLTDWLQKKIFSDAREEARKAEAADLSPPNSVKRRRWMIRMMVRRWRRR